MLPPPVALHDSMRFKHQVIGQMFGRILVATMGACLKRVRSCSRTHENLSILDLSPCLPNNHVVASFRNIDPEYSRMVSDDSFGNLCRKELWWKHVETYAKKIYTSRVQQTPEELSKFVDPPRRCLMHWTPFLLVYVRGPRQLSRHWKLRSTGAGGTSRAMAKTVVVGGGSFWVWSGKSDLKQLLGQRD